MAESVHKAVSVWLRHGLDLLNSGDYAGVDALLAKVDEASEDRAQLAGGLALARGDAKSAADCFSAVLQRQSDNLRALCGLGEALQMLDRIKAALASFRRATELAPDDVDALTGQGECSFALGDHEDARDCFELALAHAPASSRAICGIGRLLRAAGDTAGSIRRLQEGAQRLPANADIFFELGLSLSSAGATDAAITAYRDALAADTRHHGAMVNLGLVYLSQLGEPARAQEFFEAACAIYPDSVAAQANLGLALQDQGKMELALKHYEQLIGRWPDVIEYRWNRGLAFLYRGDFAQGWPDYELRHVRGGRNVRRDFVLPDWDGSDPAQHRVLVYAEQGAGDEIMFASCLPDLAGIAAEVVVECDTRLAALFARSFANVKVHGAARDDGRAWLRDHPALDRQLAIGSLPLLFRKRRSDFPVRAGYLVPDPLRVAVWKQRLHGNNSGPLAGLSWRGGTRKTRSDLRSLKVQDFFLLAQASHVRFVCLQRGDCRDEIAAARVAGLDMEWWPQALDDLDETAALIAALDHVVSVDNTVAHLAGAIGARCSVLLACNPDWRYGTDGASMPWYPSLRLLRQQSHADWRPVVAAAAAELATLSPRA